jgi:hypothetical protein
MIKFRLLKFTFLLLSIFFLNACDDGDIIVSNFNFDEETQLDLCGDSDTKLLYTIDSETNEAVSFQFSNIEFDGTFDGLEAPDSINIPLGGNNKVTYRLLNGSANANDYFCQEVPPALPSVRDEFVSTSGGYAILQISVIDQDDNDGIPAEQEDINGDGNLFNDDSDGDGIPNFIDVDDDNDNVLTIVEIATNNDPESFADNDGDGIFDHLDTDDDNDGVLTINEDLYDPENDSESSLGAFDDQNADGLPNYLNPDITIFNEVNERRVNEIDRTFRTQVIIKDVSLEQVNGNQTITLETLRLGFYELSSSNEIITLD